MREFRNISIFSIGSEGCRVYSAKRQIVEEMGFGGFGSQNFY